MLEPRRAAAACRRRQEPYIERYRVTVGDDSRLFDFFLWGTQRGGGKIFGMHARIHPVHR